MNLESKLKKFDEDIDALLVEPFTEIETKSKALALSLKRCFDDARKSKRFEYAFKMGQENKLKDKETKDLLNEIIAPFENEDFEIFREFVRLLRACSLHIGGDISRQIRECYNKTFKEDRILLAYNCGIEESKK